MCKPNLFLLIVLFATSGVVSLSQTSTSLDQDVTRYVGKWKFISKESFNGASDRKLYSDYVISIDQVEDKLRITREYVYNSVKYTREASLFLDGRGETNASMASNGSVGILKSKTRLKKGTILREIDATDRTSGPPDTETFKISDDGKRLVIERRYRLKRPSDFPKHFQDRIETDRLVLGRLS